MIDLKENKTTQVNMQLTYIKLIERTVPSIANDPDLVKSFASRLVAFEQTWADNFRDNPTLVDEQEKALSVWLQNQKIARRQRLLKLRAKRRLNRLRRNR